LLGKGSDSQDRGAKVRDRLTFRKLRQEDKA